VINAINCCGHAGETVLSINEILGDDFKSYVAYYAILKLRSLLTCDFVNYRYYLVFNGGKGVYIDGIIRDFYTNAMYELSRGFTGKKLVEALNHLVEVANYVFREYGKLYVVGISYGSFDECVEGLHKAYAILESFEADHYEQLSKGYVSVTSGFVKHVDQDSITKLESEVLPAIRAGTIPTSYTSRAGSREVYVRVGEHKRVFETLKRFNVVFEAGADSYIVPAPLLEGKLFEQSSRRDVQLQAIHAFTAFKPVKCSELQGYSLPPSREILEGLVARILGGFGFKVYVNVKLPNKAGGETEADAWAVRGDFRVYVSCKNWSSSVGRGVVEEEFGRVYNLREVPQLKVLVVGNMSDEARRTALADGFYVVELGTKAQAGNLEEVCETVQDGLMKIFTSIALPQLSQAYKLLGEIKAKVEELRKLEMLIEDLKRTLSESAVS